ncbi:MAG: Rrf2 family transcriptional regulator [Desulfobacterales bacterium]|nr:Rrf2 family transcriptional regulator [Desulfobacterales bacterium]
MQLNTLARYGMRAVIRLAILTDGSTQLASVKRIAAEENISQKYLESIFAVLKRNNILTAVKGKGGGYKLTRPLKEITTLEIIEALGGEIGPVDCIINKNLCDNDPETCTAFPLWGELNILIRDFLKSRTLDGLVHRNIQQDKSKRKK